MHRMMMKRPAAMYAVLPLLAVLAGALLFQVSDCSSPSSPEEPWTIPRPVLRHDGEPHVQRHHRNNADGTGSSSTTTTRPVGLEMEAEGAVGKKATRADDGHQQVGSAGSSNLGGALTTTTRRRPPVRLRSELPRRVLAGAPPVVEGAGDSAAKSSCHSSDVHISCPPSRN